jgi:hypothetical protein
LDREQLVSRRKQWECFNAWEAASLREIAGPKESRELSSIFRWFGEAWELAQKSSPHWAELEVDPDKIRHIQKTREYLARLMG